MRNLPLVLVAVLILGACSPDADESAEGAAETTEDSAPETTEEAVELLMAGDDWWEDLDADQRETLHEGAAELCASADENFDYGEPDAEGNQSLNYSRPIVLQLGMAGGMATVGKGDDAAESARTFIRAYVEEDCSEHSAAIDVVMAEQESVLFGQ
ncbi:hypothetical protein [Nocardiopsis valliformis]|uniref:hypothetical protein n=1 Tax=Nocardiopsis valliformis TaxID=239974 RepID=UPI00034D2F75|nr:hypothetical protein [Nocardiopsis valliformis]